MSSVETRAALVEAMARISWQTNGDAALAVLRSALTELGLKIVPVEATEEMARVSAMREVIPKVASGGVITMFAVNKWSAMLAAAPDVLGGPDA